MSRTALVLRNLIGFTRGKDWFRANDVWHFVHDCMMPWGSINNVLTVDSHPHSPRFNR